MNRARKCESTYDMAAKLAYKHDMSLLNPSDGCYQLRHKTRGWIINLYPRRKGFSPRVYSDPHRPGPFLRLPQMWTLLDVVESAVSVEKQTPSVEA